MNREEFTDVLSQNIQVTGGMNRVYLLLGYTGPDSESLLPPPTNRELLTVPVGSGFRISLSKNEKKLLDYSPGLNQKTIRATKKTFSSILRSSNDLGFRLSDITLNKGINEIVTVKNDPVIAADTYEKYSKDPHITPTFLGFTNDSGSVYFDIGMKITCTEYSRESGLLIYDAVKGIMGDLNIYRTLQNAFQSKKSDFDLPVSNPVVLETTFAESNQLAVHLGAFFSNELDISNIQNKSLEFSSSEGTWGEIVLAENHMIIYFKSSVDFSFGVRLLDVLSPEGLQ